MNALRLAFLHYRVAAMYEVQYRVNFFVQLVHSALQLGTGLIAIALVYSYTDDLGGWSRPELLAIMGVHILLGGFIRSFVQPSMSDLGQLVVQGEFDYVLTKPADAQLITSIRKIAFWHLTDVVVGSIVLVWAVTDMGERTGWLGSIGFAVTLLSGAVILYSLWLTLMSTAFRWVRVNEIIQLVDGIYQTGRWPVGIYPGWLRLTLTFLIPLAFAITVPAGALSDRLTMGNVALAVFVAAVAFALSRAHWKFQLRSYSGASA